MGFMNPDLRYADRKIRRHFYKSISITQELFRKRHQEDEFLMNECMGITSMEPLLEGRLVNIK